jgi:hypothetical protein
MTAGLYDIVIEQGTTWSLSLTWKDGDGDPIVLTGYSARMQIRGSYEDPQPMVELLSTGENPRIVLNAETGGIALTIEETVSQSLVPGHAIYDLELISPSGVVTRLLEGSVMIRPEVTR